MMGEKTLTFDERCYRDRTADDYFRWKHMHMPPGPARREHMRQIMLRYGYLVVNRKYVLSTDDSDIRRMMRKGLVKTKRTANGGVHCRVTHLVLANSPVLP